MELNIESKDMRELMAEVKVRVRGVNGWKIMKRVALRVGAFLLNQLNRNLA